MAPGSSVKIASVGATRNEEEGLFDIGDLTEVVRHRFLQ